MSLGPRIWNVSITGKFFTRSTARWSDILKSSAFRRRRVREETRGQDAAVQVVNLRPRTGVEEVNSYGARTRPVDVAVDEILTLERADVGLEVVRRPSLPSAVPMWKATALEPLKSVIVHGSTSKLPEREPRERECHRGVARDRKREG